MFLEGKSFVKCDAQNFQKFDVVCQFDTGTGNINIVDVAQFAELGTQDLYCITNL